MRGSYRGFGLFWKLLILMTVAAVIPLGIVAIVSFVQIEEMHGIITDKGHDVLGEMGEKMIEELAHDAAKQLEVYFKSHVGYTLAELRRDSAFREIAVQKVGQTGYTAVHELGTGINRFHVNPKVEDTDLHTLATKLPEFWRIMEPHLTGIITNGYYAWQDADGKIRDKFMVCVPVPGSKYGIAATTYIDEFQAPIERLQVRFGQVAYEHRTGIVVVAIMALLIAILAASIFSRRMTRPLLHLADVADRISMGELDARITVRTNDEIGLLARTLRRMQISLRAAIGRLRRK